MSQKYPGGFITKSPVAPTALVASGMWTLDQAMQLKKQGTWPSPPPPSVGSALGGGFFAGQIDQSGTIYNLVVGPVASAQTTGVQWKTTNTTTAGTTSDIDGPANSTAMNNANHPAAQFCEGLTIGGFSDWYMPAKNEMEVCYYNLKATTGQNNQSSGINPNAVPARTSNYTAFDPTQTTATNFQSTGTEDFALNGYWTSTEFSSTNGTGNYFDVGFQFNGAKTNSYRVRAIRRVAV